MEQLESELKALIADMFDTMAAANGAVLGDSGYSLEGVETPAVSAPALAPLAAGPATRNPDADAGQHLPARARPPGLPSRRWENTGSARRGASASSSACPGTTGRLQCPTSA